MDLGANEFLLKPFGFSELLARLQPLLPAEESHPSPAVLRLESLELRRRERRVTRAGRNISLTPREFALLEYLLANAGHQVTRSEIVRHVWHHDGDLLTNIVDVYVNYLRKKVDDPFEPKLIHAVRGIGYQTGGATPGWTEAHMTAAAEIQAAEATELEQLRALLRTKLLAIVNSEAFSQPVATLTREGGAFDLPCQFGSGAFKPPQAEQSPIAKAAAQHWADVNSAAPIPATTSADEAEKPDLRCEPRKLPESEVQAANLTIQSDRVEIHLHLPATHAEFST